MLPSWVVSAIAEARAGAPSYVAGYSVRDNEFQKAWEGLAGIGDIPRLDGRPRVDGAGEMSETTHQAAGQTAPTGEETVALPHLATV